MPPFDLSSLHISSLHISRVLPKLLAAMADGKLSAEEILGIVADLAVPLPTEVRPTEVRPPAPPPVAIPPVPAYDDVPEDSTPVVASIALARVNAVLSGKRFPRFTGNQLQVDPNPAPGDAFNYGTAVTFESTLYDAAGAVIDTGKFGGVGHTHTTVYHCIAPDGSRGQIGPGSRSTMVLVGARTIGAGGKNYEENNGTTATFRFGFADVAVVGEFQVWAEESGVRSEIVVSRVS